jgi:hypothetical protein
MHKQRCTTIFSIRPDYFIEEALYKWTCVHYGIGIPAAGNYDMYKAKPCDILSITVGLGNSQDMAHKDAASRAETFALL